jgi:hypothetical protein
MTFVCGGTLKAAISELTTFIIKDKRNGNGCTCMKQKLKGSCCTKITSVTRRQHFEVFSINSMEVPY